MADIRRILHKIRQRGVKYIFTDAVPARLWSILDEPVTRTLEKFFLRKPLEDIIIIESHNDFDSNGGAFYDYLIKNGYNRKYKIVWFLRNECPRNLPENVEGYRYNRLSIRRVYYHCVAKYIVCGHFMIPSIREGQKSYYTTHGGFGLKLLKGNVVIPDGINYILSPSEELKSLLASEYSLSYPNDRQITLGYPSLDALYDNIPGDLKKITEHKYDKVILWMPTFRKSAEGRVDCERESLLGIPIIESFDSYNGLNEELRTKNVLLIIKIHPMQDLETVKIKTLSNIIVLDGNSVKKMGVDNYRLMKDTDALISDYSSVAYEYLHMNKPIGYTFDDIDDYKVGLVVDNPLEYMAGHIIYNYSDLHDFISDVICDADSYREERFLLFNKVFKYHDGNSSKRLAEHMGLCL